MRGKGQGIMLTKWETGITPAYAGKSVRQSRTCGSGQGSPPPMRGKALYPTVSKIKLGITPAYAGKR